MVTKIFPAAIVHQKPETAITSTGKLTNCLLKEKWKPVAFANSVLLLCHKFKMCRRLKAVAVFFFLPSILPRYCLCNFASSFLCTWWPHKTSKQASQWTQLMRKWWLKLRLRECCNHMIFLRRGLFLSRLSWTWRRISVQKMMVMQNNLVVLYEQRRSPQST